MRRAGGYKRGCDEVAGFESNEKRCTPGSCAISNSSRTVLPSVQIVITHSRDVVRYDSGVIPESLCSKRC